MSAVYKDEIFKLRKKISVLEWDIAQVVNSAVRKMKEDQLKAYKDELLRLLNSNNSSTRACSRDELNVKGKERSYTRR